MPTPSNKKPLFITIFIYMAKVGKLNKRLIVVFGKDFDKKEQPQIPFRNNILQHENMCAF